VLTPRHMPAWRREPQMASGHAGAPMVGAPGIRSILSALEKLDDEEVLATLERCLADLDRGSLLGLRLASGSASVDLRRLASLLLWLSCVLGCRVVDANPAVDPESNETLFIGVYIGNCGWEEWKALSKLAKKQLVDEGLDDVARRVAIVCAGAT